MHLHIKGTSLNNELLQGPNLAIPLLGVLLSFRQAQFAIMADIEGMFHKVRVYPYPYKAKTLSLPAYIQNRIGADTFLNDVFKEEQTMKKCFVPDLPIGHTVCRTACFSFLAPILTNRAATLPAVQLQFSSVSVFIC